MLGRHFADHNHFTVSLDLTIHLVSELLRKGEIKRAMSVTDEICAWRAFVGKLKIK